jgi:hypothetical protein
MHRLRLWSPGPVLVDHVSEKPADTVSAGSRFLRNSQNDMAPTAQDHSLKAIDRHHTNTVMKTIITANWFHNDMETLLN